MRRVFPTKCQQQFVADTSVLTRVYHAAKCCIVEALSVKKVGPWQELPL